MLYEIISPDAFLRPYIDDYATLSGIYAVVRDAYAKTVYVDQGVPEERPTRLSRSTWAQAASRRCTDFVEINTDTIELIKKKKGGDRPRSST